MCLFTLMCFSTINAQQQIGGNIGLKSGETPHFKSTISGNGQVVGKQFYTTKTINGSPNLIREWSVHLYEDDNSKWEEVDKIITSADYFILSTTGDTIIANFDNSYQGAASYCVMRYGKTNGKYIVLGDTIYSGNASIHNDDMCLSRDGNILGYLGTLNVTYNPKVLKVYNLRKNEEIEISNIKRFEKYNDLQFTMTSNGKKIAFSPIKSDTVYIYDYCDSLNVYKETQAVFYKDQTYNFGYRLKFAKQGKILVIENLNLDDNEKPFVQILTYSLDEEGEYYQNEQEFFSYNQKNENFGPGNFSSRIGINREGDLMAIRTFSNIDNWYTIHIYKREQDTWKIAIPNLAVFRKSNKDFLKTFELTDDGRRLLYSNYFFTRVYDINFDTTGRHINYDFSLTLFPNPTNNNIRVEGYPTIDAPLYLNIYDAVGKLVLQKTYYSRIEGSIDVSSLIPGEYYLSLESPEKFQLREGFIKM
ncbi:MAG: T9SS type A sorting domain-containing protein [Saprospiraceae bacterium]